MNEAEKIAAITELKRKIKYHAGIVKGFKAELKRLEGENFANTENQPKSHKPPIPKIIY